MKKKRKRNKLRVHHDTIGTLYKALSVQVGDLFEYVEGEEKPKKKAEGVKAKERGK